MRKELDITITAEGRDKGKTFHIKEMGACQAEEWALKALLALNASKTDLPGFEPGSGMGAFAGSALRAVLGMKFADAKPLLDEMMACVSVKPDHRNPHIVRALLPDDIEEVATLFTLRSEVLSLHTGFSLPGASSN